MATATPAVPTFTSAVAYAPFGGSSVLYTPYLKPWTLTKATDADGNNVRYTFEFHNSTTVSGTSLKATCGTATGQPSGSNDGCTPTVNLPDNTAIYVRAKATDGFLESGWSGWRQVRVGTQAPAAPSISCPSPYVVDSWQDTAPTGNVVCTITATGTGYSAPGYVRAMVDGKYYPTNFVGGAAGQIKITPSSDPAVAKTTVTIPKEIAGLHRISVWAESPAGKLSASSSYSFGWGAASMTSPTVTPRVTTTGTVKIEASGPPRGSSSVPAASLRWRVSGYGTGNETVGWNTTTTPLTVTDNGPAGIGVTGIWDAATAEVDADPATPGVQDAKRLQVLLDVQICLQYASSTQCTWSESKSTVQRVPHAFGDGFPTADAGLGKVALWTGEFNTDSTDISVPGYTGNLTISRSHSTYAGATNTVNGVFGPGWAAHFDGADAGAAGMEVIDSTRIDGTIALVDGDGTALVWESPTGQRRTTADLATGTWVPADEDTDLDGSKLTVTGSGASTVISYIEGDGAVTTYSPAAAPTATTDASFRAAGVAEPGVASKTTYSYDGSGRVARILAPAPPGVTCPATGTLNPGCRALRFAYGTSGDSNGRLIGAWLDIYNPAKSGGAGMDAIKVAEYTYGPGGRLTKVTDPRSGLGTQYGYNTMNHLTSVTPPGQVPFQLIYSPSGDTEKLVEVKRDRPAGDPAGGTAQLAKFVYDVPLAGAGLPDLSAASVGRWGQKATPAKGFAVFGPDRPLSGAPGETDWQYADLQYTDAIGYTVNTAKYGAGAWQYTASDFNDQGNEIRSLDERAIRLIIDGQIPAGATADQLATLTVYNSDITNAGTVVTPAGSFVTDTYGPARFAALKDGTIAWVRPHSHTDFDEGAPNAGINPDTTLPYRLATTETSSAQDPGTGLDVEITSRTLTGYVDPVNDAATGWASGQPGTTTTDANPTGPREETTGDIVKATRYDAEGRIIETRQPVSNGNDAGTTKTEYYTTATNTTFPDCGGKPQWAGLSCKTYPAAQPTSSAGATPTLPSSTTTGYNYLLAPTTVVEISGSVTRTSTTTYLIDGRTNTSNTTVTGLASSTPNTEKKTTYDPATGSAIMITATAADGTSTSITTGYDTWGRQASYQPHGDQATTTVYDAAGRAATVTDPNGITRYTYDGTDANGAAERRGVATKVEVTTAGKTWTSAGAYDADGSMTIQKLPGGITQVNETDNAGEPTGLRYTGQITTTNSDGSTTIDPNGGWLSWSIDNDVTGRVSREWTPDGAAFTGMTGTAPGDAIPYDRAYSYDAAGRLAAVKDRTAAATGIDITDPSATPCITRTYGFDRNYNRLTKATAVSGADGACTTSGAATVTRAYDTADRPTTGANGSGNYSYDQLGRTTILPTADAPNAADGAITLGYYDNDLARSISQNTTTTTFALDAADRRAVEAVTANGGTTQKVRHYTDSSDNPTWVSDGLTTERYAELIGGDLSLITNQTGTAELPLANNHGDVITTVSVVDTSPATSISAWNSFDEYGSPTSEYGAGTGPLAYGWLGAKQRATDSTGLLLMGVRLYNPQTGLFASVDPVPGGGATAYAYPTDPINQTDLSGEWWRSTRKSALALRAWRFGKKYARWQHDHRTFSAGGCAILCYGVSYQGGTFGVSNFKRSRQYGWATPGINFGWAHRRVRDRSSYQSGGGLGAGWGGYFNRSSRKGDWEIGASYRPGGAWGGRAYYSSWTPSPRRAWRKFRRRMGW